MKKKHKRFWVKRKWMNEEKGKRELICFLDQFISWNKNERNLSSDFGATIKLFLCDL